MMLKVFFGQCILQDYCSTHRKLNLGCFAMQITLGSLLYIKVNWGMKYRMPVYTNQNQIFPNNYLTKTIQNHFFSGDRFFSFVDFLKIL